MSDTTKREAFEAWAHKNRVAANAFHFSIWQAALDSTEAAGEPVAWIVDGLDGYNERSPSVWLRKENAQNVASTMFKASLAPLYTAHPAASGQKLTHDQCVAITAAIEISEDIKAEAHDGSFLSDVSIDALRTLLATPPPATLSTETVDKAVDRLTDGLLTQLLNRAWNLGQTYWQQADSEYASQNRKSDETRNKYLALIKEACALLSDSATASDPDAKS